MSFLTPVSPLPGQTSSDGVAVFSISLLYYLDKVSVNGRIVYSGGVFMYPFGHHSSYVGNIFRLVPDSISVVDPGFTLSVDVIGEFGPESDGYSAFFREEPSYPDPLPGVPVGGAFESEMSGELRTGLLARTAGAVFISPSFSVANPLNVLDVDSVEVGTTSYDVYSDNVKKEAPQQRLFLMGPPVAVPSGRVYPPDNIDPGYVPVPNSSFTLLGMDQKSVVGSMYDTISMITTVIFY